MYNTVYSSEFVPYVHSPLPLVPRRPATSVERRLRSSSPLRFPVSASLQQPNPRTPAGRIVGMDAQPTLTARPALTEPLFDELGVARYGEAFRTVALAAQVDRAWRDAANTWRGATRHRAVAASSSQLELLHRHSPLLSKLLLKWNPAIRFAPLRFSQLEELQLHIEPLYAQAQPPAVVSCDGNENIDLDATAAKLVSGCPALRAFCCYTRDEVFAEVCEDPKSYAAVGDECLRALGRHCPRLQRFDCFVEGSTSTISVTDAGLIALARGCPDLRVFELQLCSTGNEFTDLSISILAHRCKHLRKLGFSLNTHVTEIAINELKDACLEIEYLDFLWCFSLGHTALDICAGMPSLRKLRVAEESGSSGISESAIEQFMASRPDVELEDCS